MRTPQDPLEVFLQAEQNQIECIRRCDSKTGNKHAKKRVAAARQLLAGGKASIDRFATLLNHPDANVRTSAAAWLLKDRTEQAVAALRPIAEGQGLAALGAIYTLKRYEAGELEIK
jgi:HEAT repeat protein